MLIFNIINFGEAFRRPAAPVVVTPEQPPATAIGTAANSTALPNTVTSNLTSALLPVPVPDFPSVTNDEDATAGQERQEVVTELDVADTTVEAFVENEHDESGYEALLQANGEAEEAEEGVVTVPLEATPESWRNALSFLAEHYNGLGVTDPLLSLVTTLLARDEGVSSSNPNLSPNSLDGTPLGLPLKEELEYEDEDSNALSLEVTTLPVETDFAPTLPPDDTVVLPPPEVVETEPMQTVTSIEMPQLEIGIEMEEPVLAASANEVETHVEIEAVTTDQDTANADTNEIEVGGSSNPNPSNSGSNSNNNSSKTRYLLLSLLAEPNARSTGLAANELVKPCVERLRVSQPYMKKLLSQMKKGGFIAQSEQGQPYFVTDSGLALLENLAPGVVDTNLIPAAATANITEIEA
jgi:hypothetical protein